MQVNLNYYCKLCDKTIKFKSKNKHRKSFTHIKLDNCIQRNHATENHDFIHIDKRYGGIFVGYTL